jgi:hypothetical protein
MQVTVNTAAVAHAATQNPFLMMMEPKTVVKAMYGSTSLRGLHHKTYRPLDKPWISVTVRAGQSSQGQVTASLSH